MRNFTVGVTSVLAFGAGLAVLSGPVFAADAEFAQATQPAAVQPSPALDNAASAATPSPDSYPVCSATVQDHCIQRSATMARSGTHVRYHKARSHKSDAAVPKG